MGETTSNRTKYEPLTNTYLENWLRGSIQASKNSKVPIEITTHRVLVSLPLPGSPKEEPESDNNP